MDNGVNGFEACLENGMESPKAAQNEEEAATTPKANGDACDEYSSESDALIIDESNALKKRITSPPLNPFFNESLFELSQQAKVTAKTKRKQKKPKKEYAQYLGLQPSVQFRCSKCGRAGFESLTTLNEHIVGCHDEPVSQPVPSSSSFKLTRRVFLCSACGTYYENWNLYLHMLEVHKRYLCLYCLGMFSVLDDLCAHLQSRHNVEPGRKESVEDFFNAYKEPCYLVCCDCSRVFNEQENFFYHTCATAKTKKRSKAKAQIRPEDHVTGDSVTQCHGDSDVAVTGEKSEAILYSTDDELDFRGFTESGEAVFKEKPVFQAKPLSTETPTLIENPVEEAMDEYEEEEEDEEPVEEEEEVVETRKVPKLSLKLKLGAFPQIETHSTEEREEEKQEEYVIQDEQKDEEEEEEEEPANEQQPMETVEAAPEMKIAGEDTNIVELQLEQPLDKFDIRILLQKCLNATAPFCIYCNHARRIAVNGKQLGLHAIAEHRFSAVVSSITAEELIPESFVNRIRESLAELDTAFFSLESNPNDEAVTFSHIFECFQCRYSTPIHKELYLHNRKSHAKNLLLCIMCKSSFYSYSELICHLCPGVYDLDLDIEFRCCMCVNDALPSAFRLMVHLRKRHHVCDVCLESCHDQYKLSNHVWKHKLHHFCYRCGIAYRNKPDITRHLFWKHGTESVVCKRCLQKKWPHVYHFCVPPLTFQCDECTLTFSRALALKVHKRLHSEEKPHCCTVDSCTEKFISKKLLEKHVNKHNEPPEPPPMPTPPPPPPQETPVEASTAEEKHHQDQQEALDKVKPKPKVDVYDLPALNLSESDSSDSEDEAKKDTTSELQANVVDEAQTLEEPTLETTNTTAAVVPADIWDNFKNYQANKEKFDSLLTEGDKNDGAQPEEPENFEPTAESVLRDHDYCYDPENKPDISYTEVKPDLSQSVDHDYCTAKESTVEEHKQEESAAPETSAVETAKKPESSDSSSDSDGSSCSCGSNCSCSSSSGSSSSSSDSSGSDSSTEEGRKRQQIRREKRRQKKKPNVVDVGKPADLIAPQSVAAAADQPIHESDLETTESETDEEFYDKKPQIFAKKMLEEKRLQLLAEIEQGPNGLGEGLQTATESKPKKKKSKSKKKRKKRARERHQERHQAQAALYYQQQMQQQQQYYQPPLTLTLTRNSPAPVSSDDYHQRSHHDSDPNLRASKRRRVPNKFYGYSSDEEEEKKWRKVESTMTVPPLTIKTIPPIPMRTLPPPQVPLPQHQVAPHRRMPPIKLKATKEEIESEAESNDSSNEGRNMLQVNPDALYCYCKCPYDEVSEMIGCDSRDCDIEWFHFECVGIMVPPKGHWYCPECRKKRQQKREMLKLKGKPAV